MDWDLAARPLWTHYGYTSNACEKAQRFGYSSANFAIKMLSSTLILSKMIQNRLQGFDVPKFGVNIK